MLSGTGIAVESNKIHATFSVKKKFETIKGSILKMM
jgi:prefoldin subunit 5